MYSQKDKILSYWFI